MRKYHNKHVQQKYQSEAAFRKKTEDKEEQYQKLLQKAHLLDDSIELDDNILQQFPYLQDCQLYFWYGYLQPPPSKNTAKFTLRFLQLFQPKLNKPFLFVYFNNRTPSSDYFFEFRNLFQLLPLSILQHLRSFIIVKASRYIKLMSFVGSVGRPLATQANEIYENCKQFCERYKISVKQFVQFVPQCISKEFPENLKKRAASLTNFRVNLQGQTRTEEERKQKVEFQQSIQAFIEKQVYGIENFQQSQLGIPMILQYLIGYFQSDPEGLYLEGIFRKSVGVDEQDQILARLRTRNYECLKQVENAYMIACLIKRFFYNLKVPVVPYPHYNVMLGNPSLDNIKAVITTLPKINYLSLMFLLQFLSKEVVVREAKNKMNAYNLAVCFSQALMRSEIPSEASIANAKSTVNITLLMLTNFQLIFGDDMARSSQLSIHLIGKNKQFEQSIQEELSIHQHSPQHLSLEQPQAQQLPALSGVVTFMQPPLQTIVSIQNSSLINYSLGSIISQSAKVEEIEHKQDLGQDKHKNSPLAKRMQEINSQLKSIEDRYKSRKKSVAIQPNHYKSIILEGQFAFEQVAQEQPLSWQRSNTDHYKQTVEERIKGGRGNEK